jgi:aconitate hydratase
MTNLRLKFDCLASHDITYVNIIQTAKASGLTEFPVPYVLTNCHNSLCAVGGTINEDDHLFGLSSAKKYGGIFVPAHQAVIHQYMREKFAGCGKMILGSDSHTRYGALGTMAIGEGGGELVKQLLGETYNISMPEVVAVFLKNKPLPGVGPQDVALTIIKSVFEFGLVKNKILEFVGPGVSGLSVEYRNAIDVMTTETTCLSSIWQTDEAVEEYYTVHGRSADYAELKPGGIAYYDMCIYVELDKITPMIAMPFHPSNVYAISELNENLTDILRHIEKESGDSRLRLLDKVHNNRLYADQGIIAGCAGGTFENIVHAADILREKSIGSDAFGLSIYPASQPVFYHLSKMGIIAEVMATGATVRSAFCGPCFGAGDVPFNNALSIRHTTRNFPNREGSKPADNQFASVALMDARSIAASAINGGAVTSALDVETNFSNPAFYFNNKIYENRVYDGWRKADKNINIVMGPNITDWPDFMPLPNNLLLRVASVINDPVTTTDELIPSGDTSSYRSNPAALSEYTLSRKDPEYVGFAKKVNQVELNRRSGSLPHKVDKDWADAFGLLKNRNILIDKIEKMGFGSVICANKPGDGSAREQAASCQRVLGGLANIALEYATKRYRSNLINWGLLPLIIEYKIDFSRGDFIYIPNAREKIAAGESELLAVFIKGDKTENIWFTVGQLSDAERNIILDGCLINCYKTKTRKNRKHKA